MGNESPLTGGTAAVTRDGIGVRHEAKDKEGELSPEGRANAINDAQDIFYQVVNAEGGTVFTITSSDIGRSIDTARAIEQELKRLVRQRRRGEEDVEGIHDIEIFSAPHDGRNMISKFAADKSKKYIIIGEQEEGLGYIHPGEMGFNESEKEFNDVKEFFNDSEALVSYIWASQQGEIEDLRKFLVDELITSKMDTLSSEQIAEIEALLDKKIMLGIHLEYTPEELVIHQLEVYEQHFKQLDEDFLENPSSSIFIGHAPGCDYLVMALFGEQISFENYQKRGGYRDFFEPHSFQVIDGEVVFVDFRNSRSTSEPVKIGDIIKRLGSESKARKSAWAQKGVSA